MYASKRQRLMLWLALLLFSSSLGAQPSSDTPTQAYVATDSWGRHWFKQVPQRVVVTDWTLLDNLLALGVVPVGAPELVHHHQQVGATIPATIADIGLRRAPSPKTIKTLQPDLILLGTGQKPLATPLSRISKVLFYQQFSDRYRTNGTKSRQRFLQLAAVFKKTASAEQLLAAQDAQIAGWATKLSQHYGSTLPRVSLLRLQSDQSLQLYGANSLPGHVQAQLNLPWGLQRPQRQWGESPLQTADLTEISQGKLLIFATDKNRTALMASQPWQQLPKDVHQRIIWLPPLWPYGGALSLGQITMRISQPLL